MSWQDFLVTQGASLTEDGVVTGFTDELLEKRMALQGEPLRCPLPNLALIEVSGADAAQLLQGQLTCDIKDVSETQSRLGAWCTPKGRITVLFRVFKRAESYFLIVPQFQLAHCLKRLQMFVFRSAVKLSASDAVLVGYSAPALDLSVDGVQADAHGIWLRLGSSALFYRVIDTALVQTVWMAESLTAVGYAAWQLLEIEAALPSLSSTTVDAFIPQMLHLQYLRAVSFTKGCYTGQEIVARTHYLGKVKRQMYLAHSDGACPQAGDALFSTVDSRGQSPGEVLQAQTHPEGGCHLLLVAQNSLVEANALRLHSVDGASLHLLALPYDLEVKK